MANTPDFADVFTEVAVGRLGRSLRIHSLRAGLDAPSEAAIVCLPGLGASAETMLPTARLLSNSAAVDILDLAGDGHSETPSGELDLADYAAVCSGWLEATGLRSAIWVGHSFGTQVLIQLASEQPELVERLILLSPTVDPNARTLLDQLSRLLVDGLREPPPLLRILVRDYWQTGFRRLGAIGRTALADRVEEKLPLIQAPTLVVRADKDPLVPQAWAERIVSLLPHGELVVIAGAPHAVQYAAPEKVAQAIERFLASEAATLLDREGVLGGEGDRSREDERYA